MNQVEDTPNPVVSADEDAATGASIEEPAAGGEKDEGEMFVQSDVSAVLAKFSVAPTK